jgi:hypothetical protein
MNDNFDFKKHKSISFIKSIIRIIAGTCLCFDIFWVTGILLIVAETLSIIAEEVL